VEGQGMKTNFDLYLEQQLKDPEFAKRFERVDKLWNARLPLSKTRRKKPVDTFQSINQSIRIR
jgi:hypothetical protein